MDTHLTPGPDLPIPLQAIDGFGEISVDRLAVLAPDAINCLAYGVIGMTPNYTVDLYNATESRMSGFSPGRILGQHMFQVVAPCMNNYLVAQRFEDEAELDVTFPYVLTLRLRPIPVKLRLLSSAGHNRRFILVQR